MCEKMQKFGENLTKNFGIAFRVQNNSAWNENCISLLHSSEC